MNNLYDYIKKATASLKQKDNKAKISVELFDHMDEKQKFYQQIGYDEERSRELAEEAMGNGEEISEQLYAQERLRKKVWYEIVLNIATVIFISYIPVINNSDISKFFKFEFTFLAFVLLLICFFFSARSRQSFNIFMVGFGGVVISDQLALRLTAIFPSVNVYLARFVIAAYLIVYCIFNIVMRFRINRMKYSKRDIVIEKAANAIYICVIILIVGVMFFTCMITINNYQETIKSAKDELTQAEELLLDNLDKFITVENFRGTVTSTFSDYDIAYIECNESALVTCSVGDEKNIYIENQSENPFYLGITKAPFDMPVNDILADVSELVVNSDTKPSDLPLPANIRYCSSENGIYLYFNYDEYGKAYNNFNCFEYFCNFILFTYDEIAKEFVLIDSDLANERVNTKLTNEQIETLTKLCVEDDIDYTNAKLNIYNVSEIIDTKLKNIYAIELGICYFNVNDNGTIISKSINDGCRILAQLDGKNSRIITKTAMNCYSPVFEFYAKLTTPTGAQNYRNADHYWHSDIDISNAVVTRFEIDPYNAVMDMINSINESTSNSPSLDDCISAFFAECETKNAFSVDGYRCSSYISDIDGREKFYFNLSMELILYCDFYERWELELQIIYEPDDEIKQLMQKNGDKWSVNKVNDREKIKNEIPNYAIYKLLKNKDISDIQIDFENVY